MIAKQIDGRTLRQMVLSGLAVLEANKQLVDALNVFPVPDGDTGTNMTLTMQSAAQEVQNCASGELSEVGAALARGALKGARGNSGVILSQLFRGFAQKTQGVDVLDARGMAECLKSASDMAHKALMKPKEGTILTVARVMGERAMAMSREAVSLEDLMNMVLTIGQETLDKTPDMLPVLKQAGVVDAGGKGLMCIMQGYMQALGGEVVQLAMPTQAAAVPVVQVENLEDIEFGYCSEMMVVHLLPHVGQGQIEALRNEYESFADSVAVVYDGELIKIHAHSETPYRVIQAAMQLGEITDVKIDNMREQNRELRALREAQRKPIKPLSVVAVAAGDGLKNLFADLLVDQVIFGGQTMNPSIEDIARAVELSGGENVLVLPNNPNIILAAQQAHGMVEGRSMTVVPTRSMTAGIAAMLAYNVEATMEENADAMADALTRVRDGQITYAVRDTVMGNIQVKQGDIIGMVDGKLTRAGNAVEEVAMALLEDMMGEASEMITLYYGADINNDQATALQARIEETYPACDVAIINGEQPLYYYYIAVE